MANDTGKLLKEISSLSGNMDILFQELKEQSKTNLEASKGLKDLATSIKDSNKGGDNMEQTFKSFTESFAKTFSDQNNKLISSLTEKMTQSFTGSVSDFLSNVPNQIAQVKSGNTPDFKNLLGGDTIKGLVGKASQKIPGLADGGTVEKNGLAVVGEKGPELVELKAGSNVKNNAEDALMDSLLTSKSGSKVSNSDDEMFQKLRKAVVSNNLANPKEWVDGFMEYISNNVEKSEWPELIADPVYLGDEMDYYKDQVKDRETFTAEDIKKLTSKLPSEEPAKAITENPLLVKAETSKATLEEVVATPPPAATPNKPAEQVKSTTGLKDLTAGNLSTASSLDAYRQQILNKLPEDKRKALEASIEKSGSLVKETTSLKEKAPEAKPAPTPAKTEESPKKATEELKSQLSSQMKDLGNQVAIANQKKEQVQAPQKMPEITSKEIGEIKTLLASIYSALKSPLTISSDYPFRPNSNNF